MTVVYWILAVPTAVLATLIIGLTLAGRPLSQATPLWLSFAGGVMVLGCVGWGYHTGVTGQRPGMAVLLVVGSWLAFFAILLTNGLLRQKTWN